MESTYDKKIEDTPELKTLQNLMDPLPFDKEEIKLDSLDSKTCLDCLTNLKREFGETVLRPLFDKFIIHCDTDVLFHEAMVSQSFLEFLKSLIPYRSWVKQIQNVMLVLNGFINNPDKYKEAFMIFAEHTRDNKIYIQSFIHFLQISSIKDPMVKDTLHCIVSILRAYMILKDFYPEKMGLLLCTLSIDLARYDIPNIQTLLVLQSESEDVRNLIIDDLISVYLEMYDFLSSKKLKEYLPLQKMLKSSIETVVPQDVVLKAKFLEFNGNYDELQDFNLLQVSTLINFLDHTKTIFKETFREHLLFGDNCFPLFKLIFRVSDDIQCFFNINKQSLKERPYLATFVLNKETLLYVLMNLELQMWISSEAASDEDIESLVILVPVILRQLDKEATSLIQNKPYEAFPEIVLEFLKSLDYEKVRQFQVEETKDLHERQWSPRVGEFDKVLTTHVYEFVKHQRLLSLQKGNWVFSENPLDPTNRNPAVYFIILSDNHSNLLVREFLTETEHTPQIHNNEIVVQECDSATSPTTSIPLRNISIYECEELNAKTPSIVNQLHLINLVDRKYFCEVSLLNKNRKVLLNFFADSKEKQYMWFDGLQLLSPLSIEKKLSKATQEQIDNLIQLRRNIQLMNLHQIEYLKPKISTNKIDSHINIDAIDDLDYEEDEDEVYNLETLKEVSKNFFYD